MIAPVLGGILQQYFGVTQELLCGALLSFVASFLILWSGRILGERPTTAEAFQHPTTINWEWLNEILTVTR